VRQNAEAKNLLSLVISNCVDCPLCKSRSSNLEDACSGISTVNKG